MEEVGEGEGVHFSGDGWMLRMSEKWSGVL